MQQALINNDWDLVLESEFTAPYFLELTEFLKRERVARTIYPPRGQVFSALATTSYAQTRVVILGQDPYIQPGQAHGMAFSVLPTAKVPPSLQNIYKEMNTDVGSPIPTHGHLIGWAEQGVLLLNTVLTVVAGNSRSHAGKGWERFTDTIIRKLNDKPEPVVFLLWGNDARAKAELITNPAHLVLSAPHPSPLARGAFFGCKHFSKTNAFLTKNGLEPINWEV